MMSVEINDTTVDVLVDSGATDSFVTTVGVAGIPIAEPVSTSSLVSVEGSDMEHSFLISEKTPINLMGRDLLCKLHATIHCTPDGLHVTIPDDRAMQAFQFLQSTDNCLYCWTLPDFNMQHIFTVLSIQKMAKTSPPCATLMSAMRPVLDCHCTAAFNPTEEYKHFADAFLNTHEWLQSEQILFVGPQGCALPIKLNEKQHTLFQVNDSSARYFSSLTWI